MNYVSCGQCLDKSSKLQEGGLHDATPQVLHFILTYLFSAKDLFGEYRREDFVIFFSNFLLPSVFGLFAGINSEAKDLFLSSLRRDFPRELVPVVLSPLIYPNLDFDLEIDKMTQESTAMSSNMVSNSESCLFYILFDKYADRINYVTRSMTQYLT